MTIMAKGAPGAGDGSAPTLTRGDVRTIFSMAEDEWVRDFLLRADAMEEAKLLMEPVQSMFTLSGEHVLTVNKTVSGLDEPRVLSRWLLLPAVNRGTRAAGLFIQNKSPAVCDVGSTMHFVRFVRDDATGEVLYITEIPESGSIEVMHTALMGPTSRRAAYLRFDAARFRRVFADRGDVTALIDALQTSCLITEVCACRRCGAAPGAQCSCALALQPAAHALDFRFYRRNSDHMFGTFQGRMTLSTYAAGQERSCQTYRVQNSTECSSSQLTSALLRGAVQNRMRLLFANPRNLVVSGSSTPTSIASMGSVASFAGLGCATTTPWFSAAQTQAAPVDASELCDAVDQLVDTGKLQGGGADDDVHEAIDMTSSPPLCMGQYDDMGMSAIVRGVPAAAPTPLLPKNMIATASPPLGTPPSNGSLGVLGSTTSPTSAVGDAGVVDKNMLRMIRKREAAERSNNRRHLKRVELKRQLEEAEQRKNELQVRKKQLEEERAQLQMRLDAAEFEREIQEVDDPPIFLSPATSLHSLTDLTKILHCP